MRRVKFGCRTVRLDPLKYRRKQKHRSIQAPEPEKRVSNRLETRSESIQDALSSTSPGGGLRPPPGEVPAGVSGSFPSEFRAGLRHAFLVPVPVLSGAFIRASTLSLPGAPEAPIEGWTTPLPAESGYR